MTKSNKPNDKCTDRQLSPSDLRLQVQLLGIDPEQPTLEELGKLVREHRQ